MKMKKMIALIASAAITLMSISAFAQPSGEQAGKNSFSGFTTYSANSVFDITSGIMYNHYFTDGFALRTQVRVGFDKEQGEDDANYTASNDLRLGLGIQKTLVSYKCLSGYIGLDAMVGSASEKAVYGESKYTGSNFEFGARPFMGMNIWFVPNFFVGLEWGYDVIFNNAKNSNGSTTTRVQSNTIVDIADLSSLSLKIGFAF